MNYRLLHVVLLTVLVVVTSIFCISCNHDEPAKDSVAPTIVITSPIADDLLNGTVSIGANIEDQALVKAELYVDDILVAEVNTGDIDFQWDSKSVSDGSHTLKIVALDKQGNKGQVITTIEVLNTLFTLSIPARNISGNADVWFFLTDEKGNHFGVKKGEDNTELKFETPDNYKKGDLLSLHRFAYSSFTATAETYNCVSYTGFKPGKYGYQPATTTTSIPTPVGNYTIDLLNKNSNHSASIFGKDVGYNYTTSVNGPKHTYSIPLYKNNVDFLFTLRGFAVNIPSVPLYKKVVNASVGEMSSIDANTLLPFPVNEVPIGESVEAISHYIYGVEKGSNRSFELNTYSYAGAFTNMNVYHLGNEFPEYVVLLEASTSSKTMTYLKKGELPTSFKKIDADFISFKYANNLIEASLTGTYDYVLITSSESKIVNDMTSKYNWQIIQVGQA